MSNYRAEYTENFKKHIKALKKKPLILERVQKKIAGIQENPHHYKPLRNILKNRRRTHVGSYVLIFEVHEEEKIVVFHAFQHHDEVYKV